MNNFGFLGDYAAAPAGGYDRFMRLGHYYASKKNVTAAVALETWWTRVNSKDVVERLSITKLVNLQIN